MSTDLQPPAASRTFLADVLDNLYNCVAVSEAVREAGRIVDFQCTYVNRAYLEVLQVSAEEVYSHRLLERHPNLRASGLFDQLVEVVETGRTLDTERYLDAEGANLHVRAVVKKFGDGILSAFHDIARRKRGETELKRLNEELERRVTERTAELVETQQRLQAAFDDAQRGNRAKGEFLAMVSHDLRSPLTAIQGYVGLLISEGLSPEQTEQLNVIDQCADGLLRLLDDLLRFSRLEAGEFKLENEPFLLPALFNETLDIFRPAAMQKKIALRVELDPGLPPIAVGDPAQLRRIIANLVGNALKFTERGEVVIQARAQPRPAPADGWTLEVKVTDTGAGLDPALARRLFEPYVQGADRSRRTDGGVGLGLAICRRLCQLMGGAITYERAPGQGSCFAFHINLGAMDREWKLVQ
ncbi:MAG TPA: ATP-binding protein [Opitutales bacterium]|nr:ATP-binding protein [Opitutales bacterium]